MEFRYILVASPLHDESGVRRIFSEFKALLARAGALSAEEKALSFDAPLPFFFILTGGTEALVLEKIQSLAVHEAAGRPKPLVLLTHGRHNSLPAALEIAAWAKQQGRASRIIQIAGPDDEAAIAEMIAAAQLADTFAGMAKSRIGAVGEPSSWLVASRQDPEVVRASWGATLVPLGFEKLVEEMESQRRVVGDALPESFIQGAARRAEASDSDLGKSETILKALRSLAVRESLDALTLRCFDLLSLDGSTGCYALGRLAEEGIDSGCEGDVPSIIALRWMRLLTGQAAWMANPSAIKKLEGGVGSMLLAHCTVPLSLVESYGIRSHFESGKGAAISGTLPEGPVTLLRIGGTRLDSVWIAEGYLRGSPHEEGLCRTQARIEMKNEDIDALFEAALGNHLVVALGSWKALASQYLDWAGLKRVYTKKS